MSKKLENVIIVGGGTSGWMSASTLVKFFPDKKITLVESPNIPTVGVGESTLGFIKHWCAWIGIDEVDFMPHCDATHKFSIRFEDFYRKSSGSFHYPTLAEESAASFHGIGQRIACGKMVYPYWDDHATRRWPDPCPTTLSYRAQSCSRFCVDWWRSSHWPATWHSRACNPAAALPSLTCGGTGTRRVAPT